MINILFLFYYKNRQKGFLDMQIIFYIYQEIVWSVKFQKNTSISQYPVSNKFAQNRSWNQKMFSIFAWKIT